MRRTALPGTEETVPVLGQGTWGMGEDGRRFSAEVDALREGFALGMTLVDTAEMYAGGGAERVVGEAMRDCRQEVYVVTKVWPSHADRKGVLKAVAGSLKRLRTEYVDAVLLHWPTRSVPWAETAGALAELVRAGQVRHVGVSNFPSALMERALTLSPVPLLWHEVPMSLADRRAERSLLPLARRRGHLLLAYSPLGHGRQRRWRGWRTARDLAQRRGVAPETLALAWVVRQEGVVAIPKAVDLGHVQKNAQAGDLALTDEEVRALEAAFPPSRSDFIPSVPPYGWVFRLAWAIAARPRSRG
jgi:diketogulonate reductase-like aldo/keto reductase